jgi:nitrogen fixation/metabolism regulation signal transduction histidine kinase
VGDFSNFARLPQAELEDSTLREFLGESAEQLAHLEEAGDDALGLHNVDVRLEVPVDPLPAAIDRQMLRRVVINLVRNAVQAIRDERAGRAPGELLGRVVVSARKEGDGAAIAVDDDGPGVPSAARERVFDPYFTTKKDGTGLGLAIVKKIVVEHGGRIDVGRSESLGGASFVIHLPGSRSLAIAAAREARERALQSGVKLDGAPPA